MLGLLAFVVQLIAVYLPREPSLPSGVIGLDKLGHASIFAAPVFCLLLASRGPGGRLGRPAVWVVPVVFAAHAVLSEVIQSVLLPGRDGDLFDALADWIGIALGLLLARVVSGLVTSSRSSRV